MIEDRHARARVRSLNAAVKRLGRATENCGDAIQQAALENDEMGAQLHRHHIDKAREEANAALSLLDGIQESLNA